MSTAVGRSVVSMHWIWRSMAAGLCGSVAHSLLMFLKAQAKLLPSFQPYQNLQQALGQVVGSDVHPIVPWAFSFLSGATIIGFLFGRSYAVLPGRSGATKGLVFGVLAWALFSLALFPLLGLGFFAVRAGGVEPALFSLAMLLTYSIVMGMTYAALDFAR